jgi:hypothetical protein
LTKLVNEKKKKWDEHLSTILFSYTTIYKVATRYTPYHFVYGLQLLMPTKYVLLAINGDHKNVEPISVLIAIIVEQNTL